MPPLPPLPPPPPALAGKSRVQISNRDCIGEDCEKGKSNNFDFQLYSIIYINYIIVFLMLTQVIEKS